MRIQERLPLSPRSAFTLVELIVVIGILAALAALIVLIFPRLQDSQRVAKGADVVQGQLFLAKQMALRDQAPRGLRFIPDPNDQLIHSVQLIEQPLPYNVGTVTSINTATNVVTLSVLVANFASGTIQQGDFLDLYAAGDSYTSGTPHAMHYISSVSSNAQGFVTLTLATTPTGTIQTPCTYRVVRSPRPMVGINPLNLPEDVVVDWSLAAYKPSPPNPPPPTVQHPAPCPTVAAGQGAFGSLNLNLSPSGTLDILFDTSGSVLGVPGAGKIVLWVYDSTTGWTYNTITGLSIAPVSASPGTPEQILVAVYTRTGSIVAQPANTGGSPYSFITDGNTSGM
jgi:prepilin-type N-terminal cleavage/methylation domain-containing protein